MKPSYIRIFVLVITAIATIGQTAWSAGTDSHEWTGWYAGAHLGYGWSNDATDLHPFYAGAPGQTLHPDPQGVIAGGQFGYNKQIGSFVVGIEADLSATGIHGTDTVSPVVLHGVRILHSTATSHEDVSWEGTLRPRIGYVLTPPLLLYGTGGLAYGQANYSANVGLPHPVAIPTLEYPADSSGLKVGWAAGGGIEYALGKRWSVKVEYLRIDLGNHSEFTNFYTGIPPGGRSGAIGAPPHIIYNWETAFNTFNVGINLKF